jgi:hypothetical protein
MGVQTFASVVSKVVQKGVAYWYPVLRLTPLYKGKIIIPVALPEGTSSVAMESIFAEMEEEPFSNCQVIQSPAETETVSTLLPYMPVGAFIGSVNVSAVFDETPP